METPNAYIAEINTGRQRIPRLEAHSRRHNAMYSRAVEVEKIIDIAAAVPVVISALSMARLHVATRLICT
jgi:hypothetical protein